MEAESGSEGIKLMFSQTEMSLIYLFPHLRCGARAHLGGEKEEEKASGAGHTWGTSSQVMQLVGMRQLKEKRHVSMGSRNL